MNIDGLKEIIEMTLNVPCYMKQDGCTFPCATVEIMSNDPELFGDGASKNREQAVQIDLWYFERTERDTAQQELIRTLDEMSSITAPDVLATFDNVAKKWRSTFHFIIY